jgi:membrane-associated phospholipid phosphatase
VTVTTRSAAPPAARPDPPATHFGTRAVFAGLALLLVAVPFGLLLFLVEDKWPPLLDVDAGARDSLHGFAVDHTGFVTVLRVLSTIGSAVVYVPLFALVAVLLLRRRRPRLAIFVVVTMLGSTVLNALVKQAVHRARPVLPDPVAHASGLSFPSGHAQSAIVAVSILLLVAVRMRPLALAAALAWVLAIGFARVGLGVHFVSDVLAGYVLGLAWVAAMTAAFRAWQREERPVSAGDEPDAAGCSPPPGAARRAPPAPRRS